MIELVNRLAMSAAARKSALDLKLQTRRVWIVAAVLLLVTARADAQTSTSKAVGTVKSVNGNSVILITDAGSEVTVTFADSARIVQTAPGQTNLKGAAPIAASDIQVGDRVLARGQAGEENAVVASSAIVMRKSDIAERQQREREEWRKGVGGIVKSVDTAAGTITVANALAASGKAIVIHLAPDTAIRRYAPDSVKFDDAKPGTLDQIKPGDQLRARGIKNGDATELTAQAIVSGRFRDIAGTVVSTDAGNNTVTVTDLTTKKPIVVKVSGDSQLRKLPPPMAQMIAMRLKGGTAPDGAVAAGQQGPSPSAGNGSGRGPGGPGYSHGSGNGAGASDAALGMQGGNFPGSGGPPDFQQMLSRMPALSVTDLQKVDAVILVSTEGSSAAGPTAITVLAGVEPILSAAPSSAAASSILSPWNLGTAAGAGGDSSPQ